MIKYVDIINITEAMMKKCRKLNPDIKLIDVDQGTLECMFVEVLKELNIEHESKESYFLYALKWVSSPSWIESLWRNKQVKSIHKNNSLAINEEFHEGIVEDCNWNEYGRLLCFVNKRWVRASFLEII